MSKRMNRLSIFILAVALLVATGSVFAYYMTRSAKTPIDGTITGGTEWTQTVGSFNDLVLYGTGTQYNTSDPVSAQTSRKILKLTADIVLADHLEITNDVSLDLNGYTLNLNGNMLEFRHPYFGYLTIDGMTGSAIVSVDSTGQTLTSGKIIVNLSRGLLETPFYEASPSLFEIVQDPSTMTVEDKASFASRVFEFVARHIGGNYIGDIALVTHYLSYDLHFSYRENDWYDSYGNYKLAALPSRPVGVTDIALSTPYTLDLYIGDDETVHTREFDVNVVYKEVYDNRIELAKNVLDAYLMPYNGMISGSIQLPQLNQYYGFDFRYAADPAAALSVRADGSMVLSIVEGVSTITLRMTIVPTGQTGDGDFTNAIAYVFTVKDQNNFDIATELMTTPDPETVPQEDRYAFPYMVTELATKLPLRSLAHMRPYGVTQIEYSILDYGTTPSEHYAFLNNGLTVYTSQEYPDAEIPVIVVKSEQLPDVSKIIYLTATITFETGTPVEVVLRYRLYRSEGGGGGEEEGESGYKLQYAEVLRLFDLNTNGGRTYQPFDMPSEVLGVKVYYQVVTSNAGLEGWSADTDHVFPVDPERLLKSDQTVKVKIKLTNEPKESIDWDSVTERSYSFRLAGVIRHADILDNNVYRAVLDRVNADYGNTDTYILNDLATTLKNLEFINFALSSDVHGYRGLHHLTGLTELTIVNGNFCGGGRNDFEYLPTALEVLDVSNDPTITTNQNSVTETALDKLGALTSLYSLTLDHNSIAHFAALPYLQRLTTLSARNCGLTDISNLAVQKNITTLDVSSDYDAQTQAPIAAANNILTFAPLMKLTYLQTAYIYNSVGAYVPLPSAPDTDADKDYLNEWKYHYTTLVMGYDMGVDIYNHDAVTPFAPSADVAIRNTVRVLESIVHYVWGDGGFTVPHALSAIDGTVYEIAWDYSSIADAASTVPTVSRDDTTGLTTVTYSVPPATYRIVASITTKDSQQQDITISKAFEIFVGSQVNRTGGAA